jgi:hypothetical protein
MSGFSLVLLSLLFHSADALKVNEKEGATVVDSKWQFKDGSTPVFYLVVMGKLAYRHQVSTWLSSLRKIGGWKGEAVIVTDKPKCLEATLTEAKLLGAKLSSDDSVNVYASSQGYAGNIHVIKRPTTGNINKMKLEKARAWLNVKVARIPKPVSAIIYTDEDVVIAKELTNFLNEVEGLTKAKHTLALFRDTGASAGELHTGVVVMFPGAHTDQCLQSWGKKLTGIKIGSSVSMAKAAKLIEDDIIEVKEDQLLAEEILAMGPDQQALGHTKDCKKSADHDGIKILPASYFWLPTPKGLKNGRQTEFVHFTNTGRWKTISHNTIKQYLYKIGVPENIDPMGRVADKTCQDQ